MNLHILNRHTFHVHTVLLLCFSVQGTLTHTPTQRPQCKTQTSFPLALPLPPCVFFSHVKKNACTIRGPDNCVWNVEEDLNRNATCEFSQATKPWLPFSGCQYFCPSSLDYIISVFWGPYLNAFFFKIVRKWSVIKATLHEKTRNRDIINIVWYWINCLKQVGMCCSSPSDDDDSACFSLIRSKW